MDERGARLLHLSDLHLGVDETIAGVSPARRLAEVLGEVVERRLAVDACVITGDLTDVGDPAGYRRLARLLGSCPWPVRVIPGNHDDIDVGRAVMGEAYWPATDVWSWEIGDGSAGAVVVGVSTAVPGFNHGELGDTALAEIDRLTAVLGPDRPSLRATQAARGCWPATIRRSTSATGGWTPRGCCGAPTTCCACAGTGTPWPCSAATST